MVNVKENKNWLEIYDTNNEEIVKLIVCEVVTKSDDYHPFNINQKEDYYDFIKFISLFMDDVNTYRNVEVTGKMGRPLKK